MTDDRGTIVPPVAVETEAQPSRTTFQLITSGPFARLWWAGLFSSLGDWVALFATLTLAARLGGSQAETAILVPLVARLLPGLFFVAIGGVLADRFNRKTMMIVADVGRGLFVLSLAFVDNLVQLFVLSLILELFTLLWQPSKEASVPNFVHHGDLATVNGLSLGAAYGTFPLGAALIWALDLVPDFGFTEALDSGPETLAFMVDAVTFLISAALIASIVFPARRRKPRSDGRGSLAAPFHDLKEGVSFVARSRDIRTIVLGMAVGLFGGGMLFALGESYARRVVGADQQGFYALLFALGTGAALGIIGASIIGSRNARADVTFGIGLTLTGISLLALSFVKTIVGAMGWIAFVGVGTGIAYVMGFSHLHENVEDEFRGRTFAALIALLRTGLLASLAVAGVGAKLLDDLFRSPFDNGTRNVIAIGGFIVLSTALASLWSVRDRMGEPLETLKGLSRARNPFIDDEGQEKD
jgi:dTMP kinase